MAHRTHILRCAPEQVRLATTEERALIADPENELLGIKDLMEGGTFRSSQYVDLLHQSYPPTDDVVMCPEGLEVSAEALGRAVPSPVDAPKPDEPDVSMPDESNKDAVESAASVPSNAQNDTSQASDTQVPAIDKSPAESIPNTSGVDNASASESTYGPMRRIAAKSGPSALYRPMPMQHDDFVEVMQEVLPQMLEAATRVLRGNRPTVQTHQHPNMSKLVMVMKPMQSNMKSLLPDMSCPAVKHMNYGRIS